MKRTLRIIGIIALALISGAIGFLAAKLGPSSAIQTSPSGKTITQAPIKLEVNEFLDDHLGFELTVPDDWVNRYATVDSGQSIGFSFETAASPGGSGKLDFVQVFAIDQTPIKAFNSATCNCTALGQTDTKVYSYRITNPQPPALVYPLTAAYIQQEIKATLVGSFQITQ